MSKHTFNFQRFVLTELCVF